MNITKLTKEDMRFYKLYQKWYYDIRIGKNATCEIGDFVIFKENQKLGIVTGYNGVDHYISVLYEKENNKRGYSVCGVYERELIKTDQQSLRLVDFQHDYLLRNHFCYCTKHFEETYHSYTQNPKNFPLFKDVLNYVHFVNQMDMETYENYWWNSAGQ